MNAIEDFLLNQFAGKLLTRACVTVASALAAGPAASLLAKAGIHIAVDPVQLQAQAIVLGQAALEAYKHWRLGTQSGNAAALQAVIAKAP
jgi:hypothetical protein